MFVIIIRKNYPYKHYKYIYKVDYNKYSSTKKTNQLKSGNRKIIHRSW